jgi:hypothetical protein
LHPSENGRLFFAAGKIGLVDISSSLVEFGKNLVPIFMLKIVHNIHEFS